ncbi:matrix protein [Chrysanthemum yellow dwarf virus]|uniref:Matrix protein n=1 Tax=chrysanthemum yellow dwarf associated virus TaxID=3070829 RepID=A0AAE7UEH8_9RHAB|nr:matrix protein [Chrysanthemum yellow dwarf virus]QRX38979.1 matrix protein [Chrysanthemum yellow dwarf virus]
MSYNTWMCVTITYDSFAIEYKGTDTKTPSFKKSDLKEMLKPLMDLVPLSGKDSGLLIAILSSIATKTYKDTITSPYLGPMTMRMNIVPPERVIIPYQGVVEARSIPFQAKGKRSTIKNCKYVSHIDAKFIVTQVPDPDINTHLKEHPKWFVGELDLGCDATALPSANKTAGQK